MTEAGREGVAKMPEGETKAKLMREGSFQSIVKKVLDRPIMVNDTFEVTKSNGFFWMSKPCEPMFNKMTRNEKLLKKYQEIDRDRQDKLTDLQEQNNTLKRKIESIYGVLSCD